MLGSVNLTTVEVKGVAAALDKHTPKGESKGVKAFFRIDENGLLNLEKVWFLFAKSRAWRTWCFGLHVPAQGCHYVCLEETGYIQCNESSRLF